MLISSKYIWALQAKFPSATFNSFTTTPPPHKHKKSFLKPNLKYRSFYIHSIFSLTVNTNLTTQIHEEE